MTTTEDLVRGALDDHAARVRPGRDSWGRLETRFAAAADGPRRRPRVIVAVAAAVALLLTVGVVLLADRGAGTDDASTPAGAMPDRVVAARGSELVLLDAVDGREVRTLGTFPGLGYVVPDGADGVLVTREVATSCGGNPGPEIDRVSLTTGVVDVVLSGALAPAPGPRFLAYGIWCGGRALGFTDGSGANSRSDPLGSTTRETSPSIETVEPLGWSPDGTRLLYRLGLAGDDVPHMYVGRLWPAVPQSETEVVPLPWGTGITAAAFLDDTHVALAEFAGGRTEVRRWLAVASDGAEHDAPVMFTVPGEVTELSADSDAHILARTADGSLYRWSAGEASPTLVARGIDAAAWVVG